MTQLRPYQIGIVRDCYRSWKAGKRRIVVQLATGGGKTATAAHMVRDAVTHGRRVLWLTHRQELMAQSELALGRVGLPAGWIKAGVDPADHHSLQIASVPTLVRRLDRYDPAAFGLLVVDECHHASAVTWRQILDHFSDAWALGITATPERMDGKGLSDLFDHLICGPTVSELMEQGYLARARHLAPATLIDRSQLRQRGGEFRSEDIDAQMTGLDIHGDIIGAWREHLAGQRTLVFCHRVAFGEQVAARFRSAGVEAVAVDGETPDDVRARALADFGAGRIEALVSVALFLEGLDVPEASGCIMLRPTASTVVYMQSLGRVLRPKTTGIPATILDMVGNYRSHGLVDDDRPWSLDGRPKRPQGARDATDAAAVCPTCQTINAADRRSCAVCGHVLEPPRSIREIEVREHEAQLVELQRRLGGLTPKEAKRRCRSLEDLEEYGRTMGYHPWWAKKQWEIRQQYRGRYGR